jgi:purine-nucleoside phosphorylase
MESEHALRRRLDGFVPQVLITAGSGLEALADELDAVDDVAFGEIGLPDTTVPGHSGRLVAGHLQDVPVLVQRGRLHLYEGVPARDVTATVRTAAFAGAHTFVVTNAAGGLAPDMEPGDLMAIRDHLNLTGATPLMRPGEAPVFLDMKDAYDPELRDLVHEAAADIGEHLVEGVYAGLVGPAYETPAEVQMLRTLGADAVGMSTVLEVLAAREQGMRVLGCSLITNVHRPGGTPTDHEEVLEAGRSGGPRLAAVLRALIPRLAENPAGAGE